jgi:RimJ/RimL family protein N-acetyltransferase
MELREDVEVTADAGVKPALPATILETERLFLREITTADAPFILEVLNDPAFIENVADRGVRTLEAAANYIVEKIRSSYAVHGFGFYIVQLKETGDAVGMCGLVKRETLDDVDIGYSILERFWRHGYAYEAAAALMHHGRTVLGLKRVVGATSPTNHKSRKLLEKLGLRYERMILLPGFADETMLFI